MLYLDKTHKTATKNHDISELKLFFAKMKKKDINVFTSFKDSLIY